MLQKLNGDSSFDGLFIGNTPDKKTKKTEDFISWRKSVADASRWNWRLAVSSIPLTEWQQTPTTTRDFVNIIKTQSVAFASEYAHNTPTWYLSFHSIWRQKAFYCILQGRFTKETIYLIETWHLSFHSIWKQKPSTVFYKEDLQRKLPNWNYRENENSFYLSIILDIVICDLPSGDI